MRQQLAGDNGKQHAKDGAAEMRTVPNIIASAPGEVNGYAKKKGTENITRNGDAKE